MATVGSGIFLSHGYRLLDPETPTGERFKFLTCVPCQCCFPEKPRKVKTMNEVNSTSIVEKDDVLTTEDATRCLRISKPTFLKYIRQGRIRAVKAGKGWRILKTELDRFLRGEET
jgi:excisionase family DNA binding protein